MFTDAIHNQVTALEHALCYSDVKLSAMSIATFITNKLKAHMHLDTTHIGKGKKRPDGDEAITHTCTLKVKTIASGQVYSMYVGVCVWGVMWVCTRAKSCVCCFNIPTLGGLH